MQADEQLWERLLRSAPANDVRPSPNSPNCLPSYGRRSLFHRSSTPFNIALCPQEVLRAPPPGGAASPGADAEAGRAVEQRHASQLTYAQFVAKYMAPNLPVLIEGAADGWRSLREWRGPACGPDLAALEARFGSARVCATDTAAAGGSMEAGGGPREMSLAEYVAWWRENVPAAGAAPDGGGGGSGGGGAAPWLYLKDWHFAAEFPEYQVLRWVLSCCPTICGLHNCGVGWPAVSQPVL